MKTPMVRIYGARAGKPKGTPEDETRCIHKVWSASAWTSRQCCRKRGHGQDGLFCKQHASGKVWGE